jgi:hypothetical protein
MFLIWDLPVDIARRLLYETAEKQAKGIVVECRAIAL